MSDCSNSKLEPVGDFNDVVIMQRDDLLKQVEQQAEYIEELTKNLKICRSALTDFYRLQNMSVVSPDELLSIIEGIDKVIK